MVDKDKLYQDEGGLSFQEKNSIAAIIVSLIVYAVYGLTLYRRVQGGTADRAEDYRFWATAILILIALFILFRIIGIIAFTIFNTITTRREEDPSFQDERDKLIELKATRNGSSVFGAGFLLAMVAAALGMVPAVMFSILIIAVMVTDIAGELTKLTLYRRGF
jgi:hypothetical protein